jgi:hypothetical protein
MFEFTILSRTSSITAVEVSPLAASAEGHSGGEFTNTSAAELTHTLARGLSPETPPPDSGSKLSAFGFRPATHEPSAAALQSELLRPLRA